MSWTEGGASTDTIHPEIVLTPSPPASIGSMYTDNNTPVDLTPTYDSNRTWWDMPVQWNFGLGCSAFSLPSNLYGNISMGPGLMGGLDLKTSQEDVKPDLATLKQLLTPTDSDSGSPLKNLQEQVNSLESFIMKPNIPEAIDMDCVKVENGIDIKCETPSSIPDAEPDPVRVDTPSVQVLESNLHTDLVGKLFPPLAVAPDIVMTDCKPPRLSVNGKRIGRPPGSFKVPPQPRKTIPQVSTSNGIKTCEWGACGAKFTIDAEFYQHASDHVYKTTKQTRYCKWAGCTKAKTFDAFYQLNAHVRTHTKEKGYVCPILGCGKSYSRLENLKTHVRVHTGEKPYKCSLCDKRFTNASDRAKHENRTHSTEKPYRCLVPNCDKSYTDPSSLRKHFLKLHKDLEGQFAKYRTTKPTKAEGGKVKVEQQKPPQLPLPVTTAPFPFNPMMIPANPFLPKPLFPPNFSQMFPPKLSIQQPFLNQALANLLQLNLPHPTFPLPTPIFPFPTL